MGHFHWTTVISFIILLAGLLVLYLKKPTNNYLSAHFSFVYWSVMSVYGAFVSETLVRIPKVVVESGISNSVFYNMTGITTAVLIGLGVYFS